MGLVWLGGKLLAVVMRWCMRRWRYGLSRRKMSSEGLVGSSGVKGSKNEGGFEVRLV